MKDHHLELSVQSPCQCHPIGDKWGSHLRQWSKGPPIYISQCASILQPHLALQLWVVLCEELYYSPPSQPLSNVQATLITFILVKHFVSEHGTEVLEDRQVTTVGCYVQCIPGVLKGNNVLEWSVSVIKTNICHYVYLHCVEDICFILFS